MEILNAFGKQSQMASRISCAFSATAQVVRPPVRGVHSITRHVPNSMSTMQDSAPLIVKTKLAPPRIVSLPQRRDELLASMQERKDRRLTTIVGPAGCGKTTFAAIWRKELVTEGETVCWYNLSRDDTDLTQFFAYLVAALKPLAPEIGEAALRLYNHSGGTSAPAFLASLVNDLFEHERPIYLFLEDFHYVVDSDVPAVMQQLLELAPANLHLVITSRVRPALDYVKLRVQDELNELSFSDLRFSLKESSDFLRSQGLSALGPSQLHRLHVIADGWPAGLQLLAYSLKRTKDPAAYIDRLKGALTPDKEASLSQYLNDVITPLLSEDELDFLVRISACRRFNGELCALISGHPDAVKLLERFESDGLFILAIDSDDEQQWYRLHKTFSKFLNNHLLRLPADELQRINRLASNWFSARGLRIEAIRHAIYAGDVASYVELIERSARAMTGRGQFIQLLNWYAQIPKDVARERLELLLCVAWAQIVCGRYESYQQSVAAIERIPESGDAAVVFERVLLRALFLLKQDDTRAALDLLEPYIENPPAASRFALHLLFLLSGLALVYANQFERTRDIAQRCRSLVYHDAPNVKAPNLDAGVGLSYLLQGDIRQAKAVLFEAFHHAADSARVGTDPAVYLASYLAEAHYQLDELEDAEALVAEYAPLVDIVGLSDGMLFAHRTQARLHESRSDTDGALCIVKHVERMGMELGLDRLICWSLQEQVRLQIRRGQQPAAGEALRRLAHIANRYADYRNCAFAEIPLYWTAARVELMAVQGDPEHALDLLASLIGEYEARGQMLIVASLRTRQACIEFDRHNEAGAIAAMRAGLALATFYGARRVLLDHGPAVATLLQRLLHEDGTLSGAERQFAEAAITRFIGRTATVAAPHSNAGSARAEDTASLSAKELEIVDLLAKAFSNKSIGRALNISAGTVKWHLKNIYAKLNAVSREDAVVKARNNKLIG
ncbi:LuxR C-terminal-related transcriptional regulator [Burkholderia sp. D-99]|uniref:LuxR C-terminal-related transcriptional regulator n=1 Tax=Burkholderia sp. D-99 TaxID=2717316 RepID=UPI001420DBE6|nr:LuxR C-terminal-related transcriptional regulator [Burkholderia sp. D-99]NHV25890.1 AAA family ATPase [Burkholderia sp. D-99]